jgi:uncharacterized protein HemY
MEQLQFQTLGKILIVVGVFVILIGAAFVFANKIPFFGKLPGDILIQRKNFALYFPLTTLIILNILLFLIIYLVRK